MRLAGLVVCIWLVGALTSGAVSYVYVQSEQAPRIEAERIVAKDHNSLVCAFRKFIPANSKDPRTREFLHYLVTIPPDFQCAPLLEELLRATRP